MIKARSEFHVVEDWDKQAEIWNREFIANLLSMSMGRTSRQWKT